MTIAAGVPMYHNSGPVLVPGNGSAKIMERRFPVRGLVRNASVHVPDLPPDVSLRCELWADGVRLVHEDLAADGVRYEGFEVDSDHVFTVHLVQEDGRPVTVTPDIAYIFQEKAGAAANPDI